MESLKAVGVELGRLGQGGEGTVLCRAIAGEDQVENGMRDCAVRRVHLARGAGSSRRGVADPAAKSVEASDSATALDKLLEEPTLNLDGGLNEIRP